MSIADIWTLVQTHGGTAILIFAVFAGIVEIAPIKVNPWSALVKWFGKNINANIVEEIAEIKSRQEAANKKLDNHIQIDDERAADDHRYRILRFNSELIRGMRHTEEEFNEILYNVKRYNEYCRTHENYSNHRATLAMQNIDRVYMECAESHNFL